MNSTTREIFRNEIKTLTYKRRLAKNRFKQIQKESTSMYNAMAETKGSRPIWKHDRYDQWVSKYMSADALRYRGAVEARHIFIAYGLLRGVPYEKIEHKCKVAPVPEMVHRFIQDWGSYVERKQWTLDLVKERLTRKEVTEVAVETPKEREIDGNQSQTRFGFKNILKSLSPKSL